MIHDSIVSTIGHTPIVRLNRLGPKGVQLFVKLEAFNPMASVKDRLAWAIIHDAEVKGLLKPGQTVIEATSGNTGVGLALVGAVKGYKCIFVMPEKMSEEKRALLRAYGARVVLTPMGVDPDHPLSHYSASKKIAA